MDQINEIILEDCPVCQGAGLLEEEKERKGEYR